MILPFDLDARKRARLKYMQDREKRVREEQNVMNLLTPESVRQVKEP